MCGQDISFSGQRYARMLYVCLLQALYLTIHPHDKRITRDGDPSQNSAVAQEMIDNLGEEFVPTPPWSPDLNPIENLFHLTGRALIEDTTKIHFKEDI